MTVERRQSPQGAPAVHPDEAAAARRAGPAERPMAAQVEHFRAVFEQARGDAGGPAASHEGGAPGGAYVEASDAAGAISDAVLDEAVGERAARRADELGLSSSQPPAEYAAMLLAQASLRDGSVPVQAPTRSLDTQSFFELVERHVRQMAVAGGGAADGDGQVLLRMSDATLPGTDLLLSRGPEGWTLRADVRSRASHDAIREAGPELARRFAERNLGTLSVESHFNG